MNQGNNAPSELEIQLSSNAIDAVMGTLNLGLSPQQLQEFKEQTIKDAQAIANEWEIEQNESEGK
ncbi:MAG: hypothetical protein AB4372_30895 [Xenococcus sp. (in: cyanobacteria)]